MRRWGARSSWPWWFASLGLLLVALGITFSTRAPAWVVLAVGMLAGGAVVAAGVHSLVLAPLSRMASTCESLGFGNLSATFPESGPVPLREVGRTMNTMTADFQEVLLLVAHAARSMRQAVNSDGGRLLELERGLSEVESMVQDFRYFRVRLEDGGITDTGVATERCSKLEAGRGGNERE
jgi:methyl-accepting chemotaxis protein